MRRLRLAELSPAMFARIADAYTEGVSIDAMCKRFNVSRDTLQVVLAKEKPRAPIRAIYIWPSSRKRKPKCTTVA